MWKVESAEDHLGERMTRQHAGCTISRFSKGELYTVRLPAGKFDTLLWGGELLINEAGLHAEQDIDALANQAAEELAALAQKYNGLPATGGADG